MQIAKKAKEKEKKHAEANGRKKLGNVRVIQRNLVYVTNLALSAATEEILKRDYFGRFGKIKKVVVNRNNVYQGPQGPSVCAYITYFRGKDAQDAIKHVDGTVLDGRLLRASFGTTKYCSYFLRNVRCPNPDCMYLHELGADVDSFTKEDMAQGKHLLSNVSADRDDEDDFVDDEDGSTTPRRGDLSPRPKPRQQVAWKTVSVGSPVSEHSAPLQSSLNPEEWPDPLSMQNTKGISKKYKPGNTHGTYTLSSSPRPEGGRSEGSADSSQDDELSDSGDSPRDHRPMHGQNSWGSQDEFEEHGKSREVEARHTTNGHRNNYYTNSNHNTPDMENGPKQRKNHLTPKKQTEWRKIQTKPQSSMLASSLPSEASALGSSPSPISVGDAGLAASAPTSSTPMGSSGGRDSGPVGDGDDKENHTIDKLNITMDILRSPEKASRPRNIVAPKPYAADDFLSDYRLTETIPNGNGNHGSNMAWGNHSNKLSSPLEIPHDTDERSPREVWGDHVIPGRSDMVQSPEPAYSSAFRNRTQVPNQLQVNHMAEFGETPELPGFDDWLRVKFTDLLLDESNHQNGKSAEISPESIWNENLVIFSSSPAGKSRFNFARDEGTVDDSDRENHVNGSPNSLSNSFVEFRSSANITIQQPLHHTPRGQLQMNSNHHVKRAPNHNFNHVIDEEQSMDGMFPQNTYNHKQRVLQPKQQQHRQQQSLGQQQPNNQLFHSYEFGAGMNNPSSWSPAPAPTHVPSMYVQTPTKPTTHKAIPPLQNNIPTHPSLAHQQTHVHSPSKTPRSTWGQPTAGHEHPNGTNANMGSNGNGYWQNNTVPAHPHTYTHKSAAYTQNDAHKATLTGLEKY